jgi:hypothetical protein
MSRLDVASTRSPRSFLAPLCIVAGMIAGGALAWALFGREPAWARTIDRRFDAQERMLEQQQARWKTVEGSLDDLRARQASADLGNALLRDNACDRRAALETPEPAQPSQKPSTQPAVAASAAQAGEHARDEAARLVERAASAGNWGPSDVQEFRSLLHLMTPAQRDQAMSAVTVALNEGRLTLTANHPF